MIGLARQDSRKEHWFVKEGVCGAGDVFLPLPLPGEELYWAEASRAHLEQEGIPWEQSGNLPASERRTTFTISIAEALLPHLLLPQSNSAKLGYWEP